MTSVWFDGIGDLLKVEADLATAGARVGALGAVIVRRTAFAIEGTSKQLAPVDTGALRGSIGTDFHGDGRFAAMEAEIGPTQSYGAYVEWGTARMAPQPYMTPALDRHSPEFIAAIEQIADPLP